MTQSSATDVEVIALDDAEISFEPWQWPFAAQRRGEIDRHFASLQSKRSGVWNGRILLLHRYAIRGRKLYGACFETDYASFCSWRDWGFPDASVYNVFATTALRSIEGAFLVGEMASSTANAGLVTFPCGTPEPSDLDPAGTLDLKANLGRELLEETGIDVAELRTEPGWTLVRDRCYIAFVKLVAARENADALRARVLHNLAREQRPEFVDVRMVRSPADLEPGMPLFLTAFLTRFWS